ncbi:MAG: LamG domain-containing protein [Kiritimatiellae bacterium]|nr:LamG domain-containing protein [Kiritimatiellia bacterium]MBQ3340409.1 LamG domain-containing protein [Kiritimatiellia bacterium]
MKTLPSTLVLLALSSELSAAGPRTPFAAWDDVENPASLTNGLAMPPAFTAMAWFEAGSFADFAPVLTYTTDFSSWTNGFGIFTMSDGSLAAYVRSMDDSTLVADGLRTDEPCHVALVYSGSAAALYVNGVPRASTNFASTASLDCGGALWAGTPPGSHASPPFDGAFAGVRLYPSALDWTSIASEFSAAKLAHLNDLGQGSSLFDYDGDGMPDEWELRFGLNPCNPADASLDSDGDGVSNADEFRIGCNPRARAVAAPAPLVKSCTATAP